METNLSMLGSKVSFLFCLLSISELYFPLQNHLINRYANNIYFLLRVALGRKEMKYGPDAYN